MFLGARLPELSRSQIQRLIRAGHITVNGQPAKSSAVVEAGDDIEVTIPEPAPDSAQPEPIPLAVLHEDADIIVVDKPADMVVHPAAGHAGGTLVNALLHHATGLSGVGGRERPGIVHRLDRGTSGVMVVAKHDRAHRELSRQFQDREVSKTYLALVWGTPKTVRTIDTPIGRDPRNRKRMSGRAHHGRTASTTIEHVDTRRGVSLVTITIGTGRTHQIRVHLSEAGHAIVGDELYGGTRKRLPAALAPIGRLKRPFLHAFRLAFAHPADGRAVSFEAPLPEDLAAVWKALGGDVP